MKITKITFNEKQFIFNLLFYDKTKLKTSYDSYEKLQLKVGLTLSNDQFEYLVKEDLFIEAKRIAYNYINYKQRTEFEIKQRLKRDKIPNEIIEKTISYLIDKLMIDDTSYAHSYIEQLFKYKNFSKRKIELKLFEKGISKEISNKVFEKFDIDQLEKENALILAKKRSRQRDLNDEKEYNRLFRYLLSNGFSYNLTRQTLDQVKDG